MNDVQNLWAETGSKYAFGVKSDFSLILGKIPHF
jgi:hypothetical protein